jgi:hypothetical protein
MQRHACNTCQVLVWTIPPLDRAPKSISATTLAVMTGVAAQFGCTYPTPCGDFDAQIDAIAAPLITAAVDGFSAAVVGTNAGIASLAVPGGPVSVLETYKFMSGIFADPAMYVR